MHEKRISYHLKSLGNIMKRYFENKGSIEYARSITGENVFILRYLGEHQDEPIYQKDIERRFSITRSTTSKVISLMEEKGLVRRLSVEGDRRLKQIVLTEDAQKLHAAIQKEIDTFERLIRKGFTQEEIDIFITYINRVKDNLQSAE